jgi:transposase
MEAEVGMLVVETISKIRRAYFVHGQPIKAICRELGVSRKVVRKVIRSEATEFRYERETQPLPKMGPWSAELDRLLVANESKAARERLTLIRLFEELRSLGYAGGYDAVRRYARRWGQDRGESTTAAYVPLSFAPGEAYQFDWPRSGPAERGHGDCEGGACPALPQPDAVRPGLSARDAGDGV